MPTLTARQNAIAAHILKDPFARKLGARFEAIRPGYSRVVLKVADDMINFHGMTHGGVIFALGDMAFAAAGNATNVLGFYLALGNVRNDYYGYEGISHFEYLLPGVMGYAA